MELTFNPSAREKRIKELFNENMNLLKDNLSKGIKETEMYIEKDVAGDVRSLIEKEIEGKNITFCIVRTGSNQYTGRAEHFSGMLVGDNRYYKLKYTGE